MLLKELEVVVVSVILDMRVKIANLNRMQWNKFSCINGKISGNKVDGCECTCDVGYTGTDCNTKLSCTSDGRNNSESMNCNGHGNITGKTDNCSCVCDTGYTGRNCNRCSMGYTSDSNGNCHKNYNRSDCNNKGIPKNILKYNSNKVKNNLVCDCDRGWTGDTCFIPLECSNNENENNNSFYKNCHKSSKYSIYIL